MVYTDKQKQNKTQQKKVHKSNVSQQRRHHSDIVDGILSSLLNEKIYTDFLFFNYLVHIS